ncbi:Molybdopterin or thiamine biosynthesis adenylyltransferase [Epibacterium ulvae]|uniref:Molybdopterin or thiamine biosynthesis adenylyltransferase n=1 Tax=Epibacterium ulvae TaxID=1156985 RepID=A0A1G5PNV4_9RHOB|nr:ThiF family adenylyltransferase [Epibacterium ulvae]SCZ51265.1 Molybdopterin or thiamine biosynthesis adenylyltransferase [Epibacterium ulvae]
MYKLELDAVLQSAHFELIERLLDTSDGSEASAYMLFGNSEITADPWSGAPRLRVVSHKFVPIAETEKVSSSARHVTWSTGGFMRLLSKAKSEGLIPALVHTHPRGVARFSSQDDKNEKGLARTAFVKGVKGLLSIVIDGGHSIAVRLWTPDGGCHEIKRVTSVGPKVRFLTSLSLDTADNRVLDRQARLFGSSFNDVISQLRIGVVGAGATGSAVATLLIRLGFGRVLVVDKDVLELSNLNRVHGARRCDVQAELTKVKNIARLAAETNLGPKVIALQSWAGSQESRDALKSCDVVFGATDDHSGRIFLNRLARFYSIPLIDLGLRMKRHEDGHVDVFGRVTTFVEGHRCLMCHGIIDPQKAADEALERDDPDNFHKLKEEAYILGGGDPSPAVVTFTTEVACMAVNELVAALTSFQGPHGMTPHRVRRFHAQDDRFPSASPSPDCPICSQTDVLGRADVEPFLGTVG